MELLINMVAQARQKGYSKITENNGTVKEEITLTSKQGYFLLSKLKQNKMRTGGEELLKGQMRHRIAPVAGIGEYIELDEGMPWFKGNGSYTLSFYHHIN